MKKNKLFEFTIQYGFELMTGYIECENILIAKENILKKEWDDIIDSEYIEKFVQGIKIQKIWEIKE